MNRIQKLNSEKNYPLYSAALTALLFLLTLAFSGILGFGNKTILSGDLFSQYSAFIQSFLNVLKGNGSFYYSFSLFLGNPATAGYAYYCLSPFNLLYLIPGISVSAMTAVIITLKLSLAAAAFQFFLSRGLKEKSPFTILFGAAYGLCTFAVTMCIHIMWLDALYILPILILLLLRYVKGSSVLPLVPVYAYLFLTNFYMGYIAGIFSALCLIVLLILELKGDLRPALISAVKKGLLYAGAVLLAVGICALFLLPAAFELLDAGQSRSAFSLFGVTIPDVICNLFPGEMQGLGSPIPLIYCGLPVLFLLPAFFAGSSIEKKEKYAAGFLLLFFLAASQFLPLYRFLHAMEAPNWYAHRYAFCMVFLILSLCCRALPYIRELSIRKYAGISAAMLLLYAILIPVQRLCYGGYHTNSYVFFLLSAVFLIVYLLLYHYRPKYAPLFFAFLFSAELLLNAYTCFSRNDFGFQSEADITAWENSEQSIIPELLSGDPDLYRIRVDKEICFNAPSRFGYAGLNTFTTTDNAKLRETLSSLGIGTSFMSIYDHGYTDITDMLFGVKYSVNAQTGEAKGSPLALPVGFMCSPGLLSWDNSNDVFSNQENLVSLMANKRYSFYSPLEIRSENVITKNMEIYPFEDATLFQHISDLSVNGNITFTFPDSVSENVLAHFTPESEPVIRNTSPVIEQYVSGFCKSRNLSDGSIVHATYDPDGVPEVKLQFAEGPDFDYAVKSMLFVSYDKSRLAELRKDLGSRPLTITSYEAGEINGVVTSDAERPVLFLSIPYDSGWKAYVDDAPVPVYAVMNDSFLSLELTPGEHRIRLLYEHPGADAGRLISGASLILFLILYLLKNKRSLSAAAQKDEAKGSEAEA
ncbi:MAG: YfhO family protein [Lachnospiraceae bacterium]|nr:YfhO family protein [Lachnospiraceae bacterium]